MVALRAIHGRIVLINRDYTRLWMGQAASSFGDQLALTTAMLWIGAILLRGARYAPATVAGLLVAEAFTVVVVAPVAGVYVDRWDRRRTMMASDMVRGALYAGLAAAAAFGLTAHPDSSVMLIYTVTVSAGAAGRFFYPARAAYIADIVPGTTERARASGIGQATDAAAIIAGPSLAAPLLFTLGPQCVMTLTSVAYFLSLVAVRSVHVPAAARPAPSSDPTVPAPRFRAEFAAGARFIAGNRVLAVLIVTIVVSTLGAGALTALGVFFTTSNLHAAPKFYSLLALAFGAGVAGGSLCAGTLAARYGVTRVLSTALLTAGLLVAVYAKQGSPWPALVVLGLIGLPVGALNTVIGTVLLTVTPRELLGRVNATINPIQQLASMVSMVAAGWLVSTGLAGMDADVGGVHFGPIDTVYFASALPILGGGFYALVALRNTALHVPSAASTHESYLPVPEVR